MLIYKRYVPTVLLTAAIGCSFPLLNSQDAPKETAEELKDEVRAAEKEEKVKVQKIVVEGAKPDGKKTEGIEVLDEDREDSTSGEIEQEKDFKEQNTGFKTSLPVQEETGSISSELEEIKEELVTQVTEAMLKAPEKPEAAMTSTTLELKWHGVEGVEEYEVQLNDGDIIKVDTPYYRAADLVSGMRYICRVRTSIGESKGRWSQPADLILPITHKKNVFMLVDGKAEDWNNKGNLAYNEQHIPLKALQDEENLYCLIEGENEERMQIAIDCDNSSRTGYKLSGWKESGIDYLVAGEELYRYIGNGEDWSWEEAGTLDWAEAEKTFEVKIPLSDIGLSYGDACSIGLMSENGELLPGAGSYMPVADEIGEKSFEAAPVPELKQLSVRSYFADVAWYGIEGALSYEVEWDRKVIEIKDPECFMAKLKPGTDHRVRIRAKFEDGSGPWSPFENLTMQQREPIHKPVILSDGSIGNWNEIPAVEGQMIKAVMAEGRLHLFIPSQAANLTGIYLETDGKADTGLSGDEWKRFGMDYFIDEQYLYSYIGDGTNWNWQLAGQISERRSESGRELIIPIEKLQVKEDEEIYMGIGMGETFLPDEGLLYVIAPEK